MNNCFKLFFLWCVFFGSLTVWRVVFLPNQPTIFSATGMGVPASVPISVNVIDSTYYTYTKAFDCECDVLITCQDHNLINQSTVAFYYKEVNNSKWCE